MMLLAVQELICDPPEEKTSAAYTQVLGTDQGPWSECQIAEINDNR